MSNTQMQKNGPAAPAKPKIITLKEELGRLLPALKEIAPKHVDPERLVKVVISSANRTPALLECTILSLGKALMQAGEIGLEIGGVLGEAYLVPYTRKWKDENGKWHSALEAQCIVGYRGFIKLARQSGEIQSIAAGCLLEGDTWDFDLANNKIVHRFDLRKPRGRDAVKDGDEKDPGLGLVGVYAKAVFVGGAEQLDVMSRAEVERIRARSKAGNAGPWMTDYYEMAKKTVVRRLSKYLPLSPNAAKQLEHEDALEPLGHPTIDVEMLTEQARQIADQPKAKALASKIRQNAAKKDPEPEPPPADEDLPGDAEPPAEEDGRDDAAAEEALREREPGED